METKDAKRAVARGEGRGRRVLLWALAFLVMAGAVIYQRRTGPTYPKRGRVTLSERAIDYRLLRSHSTNAAAPVEIAAPAGLEGTLRWRRLRSGDDWTLQPMTREGEKLVGRLPAQPPAGKVEYLVELAGPTGADGSRGATATIPESGEPVVLRYKGDVPLWLLLPHVVCMFLGLLIGVRTGLAALFAPTGTARLGRAALVGLTLGGMILGPMVQKRAFGAYWTGFPFGGDLTDNKTLIMWGVWLLACLVLGRGARETTLARRGAVLVSTIVLLVTYMVPHSLRGSELDYRSLDQGVSAKDAIHTG